MKKKQEKKQKKKNKAKKTKKTKRMYKMLIRRRTRRRRSNQCVSRMLALGNENTMVEANAAARHARSLALACLACSPTACCGLPLGKRCVSWLN